jgi:hypothetical protein
MRYIAGIPGSSAGSLAMSSLRERWPRRRPARLQCNLWPEGHTDIPSHRDRPAARRWALCPAEGDRFSMICPRMDQWELSFPYFLHLRVLLKNRKRKYRVGQSLIDGRISGNLVCTYYEITSAFNKILLSYGRSWHRLILYSKLTRSTCTPALSLRCPGIGPGFCCRSERR